jgi:hypothetical protein
MFLVVTQTGLNSTDGTLAFDCGSLKWPFSSEAGGVARVRPVLLLELAQRHVRRPGPGRVGDFGPLARLEVRCHDLVIALREERRVGVGRGPLMTTTFGAFTCQALTQDTRPSPMALPTATWSKLT